MTLERLVAEIQSRASAELEEARRQQEGAKAKLQEEREREVHNLQETIGHQAEEEAKRERQRLLAGAKMQAKKLEYEARERALGGSLESVRQVLAEYTRSSEYPEALRRMFSYASSQLGKDLRVSGRTEDASLLRSIAGKAFDPAPVPILGGLVATTANGERRLTLSFDELLRLRESELRDLLAS
jgi:V/A-type H+/Na+-transporting ATPase subunit E